MSDAEDRKEDIQEAINAGNRAVECLFDDIDRYDDDFWEQVFKRTEAIMVMPENNQVTYPEWLTPTKEQREVLDQLGYERVGF